MSKFKQILQELCGTALNIPAGELTALVDKAEDEIDVTTVAKTLKEKYRENLNAFGANQKTEGFQSGQRAIGKKLEDSFKSKFGITSDKTGDDLIEEVFTAASKKAAGGKDDMTEDKIKMSQVYLNMEKSYQNQLKKAQEDGEKAVNDLKAGYTKRETFSDVRKALHKLFDSEGYHFDDDATRAANKREDFIDSKFGAYEWQKNGDDFIAVKDGKPVENEYGHKVSFKDLVTGVADKFYAKKVTDKRQSPHSSEDDNGGDPSKAGKSKFKGALPKTQDEYDAILESNIPIDQRMEVRDFWRKKQSA